MIYEIIYSKSKVNRIDYLNRSCHGSNEYIFFFFDLICHT